MAILGGERNRSVGGKERKRIGFTEPAAFQLGLELSRRNKTATAQTLPYSIVLHVRKHFQTLSQLRLLTALSGGYYHLHFAIEELKAL